VRTIHRTLVLLSALLLLAVGATPGTAASTAKAPRTFASPDEAVKTLAQAVREGDSTRLLAILGPGSREIISSGDPVADKSGRERFITLYDEKVAIEGAESGRAIISLGNEGFPFPIPVVKKGSTWRFDARAGRDELLTRRIGRNELEVMDVMRAYVDAQRDYASKDRNGDGVTEFARKIRSTPGTMDGLYWQTKEGEEESPLGPLAAQAVKEGYSKENTAFHGYYFKILTAQGKAADGGAFDYLVNGRMILGFAMVAYPAQYGASGIMTFIVNQKGIVYQKNLGKDSAKIATSMKLFNPDSSWKKVE
jgi:hypothetical protein